MSVSPLRCIPYICKKPTAQGQSCIHANYLPLTVGARQLTKRGMSNILSDIEAFCATHQMPVTRFGELAMNDKPFVGRVRDGRRLWPETEARVRRFMATYRPDQDTAA
jgi:hypothetical protein